MREAIHVPDNIGGFVRYYEIPELIRVAAQFAGRVSQRHAYREYGDCALARARAAGGDGEEIIHRFCTEAVMSPLKT